MNVTFSKIPSAVRRLNLGHKMEICGNIVSEEGAVVAVEALSEAGRRNTLEFPEGRVGHIFEGDIIPGVLCKRRSSREFSGDIPDRLHVGDTLDLIGSAGLLGITLGGDPRWGRPLSLKVLGSVIRNQEPLNIRSAAIPWQESLNIRTPIIAVAATCMEVGKTTTLCRIIRHFTQKGLKVASAKLTGLSYTEDTLCAQDAGADPAVDFLDGGLPSTCGNPDQVVRMAFGLLTELEKNGPDLIVAEFGDGILGEYNVAALLEHPMLQKHVRATIIATMDTTGAWGAREIMNRYGLPIAVITGPVANNPTYAAYTERTVGIVTESNFGLCEMPRTMQLLEEAINGPTDVTQSPSN